jgi:hypothetical protein
MIEEKIFINVIQLYKKILKILKNINFMLNKYSWYFFHNRHILTENVKIPIKPTVLFEKDNKIE